MSGTTYSVTMHELDESSCLRLLGRVRFGRVAFGSGDGISVLPVNSVFVRGSLYFRTARESSLHRLGTGQSVVFEADHVDHVAESGWSVVARGLASYVDDDLTLAYLAETDTHPWAPGERDRWICIEAETVTGRRIERHAKLALGSTCHTCLRTEKLNRFSHGSECHRSPL